VFYTVQAPLAASIEVICIGLRHKNFVCGNYHKQKQFGVEIPTEAPSQPKNERTYFFASAGDAVLNVSMNSKFCLRMMS